MPPMAKATVPIIVKVVDPSSNIIQKLIKAATKKIAEATPYVQDFACRFDIVSPP